MATKKKAPAKKAAAKKAKGQAATKAKRSSSPKRATPAVVSGDVLADILPEPVVRKMPAALLGAINGAPAGRQRAMRRAWTRGLAFTIDSVSVETLQAIKTDAGTFVASLIFECSEERVLDKLGVQRKRRSPSSSLTYPQSVELATLSSKTQQRIAAGIAKYSPPQGTPAVPEQPVQKRAARVLVNDAHLVVPLSSVAVGATIKTPDAPDEGLEGTFATVITQGVGSVTVKPLATTRRVVRDRNGVGLSEFDAPGRITTWAPGAMVVVVADGYDAACDERSYGDPHVDDDEKRVAVERAEMQF